MTPAEFTTYVRYKTRTNSTTFTDADILALMKVRQDEIAKELIDADEDILMIPQTATLIALQREYPFPNDLLSKIKRVEAELDGSSWIQLRETDLSQLPYALTEDNITSHFSNAEGNAFYDLSRRSIYILSGTIIDVASGLKIWCSTWPAAVTNLAGTTDMSVDPSTTTHGIPREMHEIWARGVIIDYKQSREKPIPLSEIEMKYDFDKKKSINALRNQNMERDVTAHLPPASERGDNGYNY